MPKVQVVGKTQNETTDKRGDQKDRVAIYARVSTDKEEQRSSLEFQRNQKDYVEKKYDCEVVEVYVDEGVSGTSAKKRKQFLQLIEDCKAGNIDWVFTKNVSRFARNLRDLVDYISDLEKVGVYVVFEEENMRTCDETAKLVIHILGTIAEQESKNTSAHVKTVIRQKHSKGHIAVKSKAPLGYDFVKGKDPETGEVIWSYKKNKQAPIVEDIFRLCIEGHGTAYTSNEIYKKYNRKLPKRSIEYILTNVVYKGDLLLGKTYKDESGKRSFNKADESGEYEKEAFYVSGNHDPIVSAETFELAQKAMQERKDRNGKFIPNGEDTGWSQKIVCEHCGSYLWTRKHKYLQCSNVENKSEWDNKCTNTRIIRIDGLEQQLKLATEMLLFDAKTYKTEHYTLEQINALKQLENIVPEDIQSGSFTSDEYSQTLTVSLSMGVDLKLTTDAGNAMFTGCDIAIDTNGKVVKP